MRLPKRAASGIVSDHQHGLAQLLVRALQHLQYRGRILRVEISGGLVGQHDRRFVDQRPCQGNALLLAAAQLAGTVIQALVDAKQLRDVAEVIRILIGRIAGNVDGQSGYCRAPSGSAAD